MRRSLKACVLVAAVSGVLGAGAGPAFADGGVPGGAADAPGTVSGNAVRVEVHAPFSVCGNSLVVVGVLSHGTGNGCGNGAAAGRAVPVRHHAAASAAHRWRAAAAPARAHRPHTRVRSEHDRRVGAVARAGRSAGKALLAASGAERLKVAAGAGGALLVAGAALLRRARRRQG
ncbi:chaplin [Streptomyces sp. S186]|uniref:chaplin n=1 Tax=Streptomyces sp. S186 TaxID=3434395 RepID=UPI003F666C6A